MSNNSQLQKNCITYLLRDKNTTQSERYDLHLRERSSLNIMDQISLQEWNGGTEWEIIRTHKIHRRILTADVLHS
jgi:hypothetical protein